MPRHLDDVAIRYPDVKIVMAHLSHPYGGECAVTVRKHPNVYTDVSAIHYRPWQLYNALMLVQEYGVWDKLLFGTDYPFASVDNSMEGLRSLKEIVEGTNLPRLHEAAIESLSEPMDWKPARVAARSWPGRSGSSLTGRCARRCSSRC